MTPAKQGRPRLYNDELAEWVLEEITAGVPLAELIRGKDGGRCPSHATVRRWAEEDPTFAARLKLARLKGFEPFVRKLKGWEEDSPENADKWRRYEGLELTGRLSYGYLAKWDPKRLGEIVPAGPPVKLPRDLRGPMSAKKALRQLERLQESVKGLRERVQASQAIPPA